MGGDGLLASARLYVSRQADSLARYVLQEALQALAGWAPSLVGIGVRALLYRTMLHMDGWVAIEKRVRLRMASRIRLGRGVYLDEDVYVHAGGTGVDIGAGSFVMRGAILHVFDFRNLPRAGIRIGRDCLVSEYTVVRGQGGVTIGDRVYTSPGTKLVAVNHVFDDPHRPFVEQGITAQGIVVEDDVWLGAGVVVTDGVRIGRGAVVAAGAVVTEDVPAHTVVAGVPARVVRNLQAAGRTPPRAARAVHF